MAYPPPPGLSSGNPTSRGSSSSPHPSLPARPPASAAAAAAPGPSGGFKPSSFKPAFPATPSTTSYSGAPGYGAAAAAPGHYGPSSYPSYSKPASVSNSSSYQPHQAQSYAYPQHGSYQHGGHNNSSDTYGAAPQIRNPFPAPNPHHYGGVATGVGGGGADPDPYTSSSSYDPDMAAQIAQWQSAYSSSKDDNGDPTANTTANNTIGPTLPGDGTTITAAAAQPQAAAATAQQANPSEKKKTVAREGGGKKWTDDTLLEWDPSHPRLFVGNLAGETTDDALLKAFSRWPSVQKARVIRDKRSSKSKGYGFVSFADTDDFFQAAKEMNGKYIQSHPVVVRKANTEIKVTNSKGGRNGGGGHGRGGGGKANRDERDHKGGNGSGGALGPVHHGGVSKPGQKTKNGLKILG